MFSVSWFVILCHNCCELIAICIFFLAFSAATVMHQSVYSLHEECISKNLVILSREYWPSHISSYCSGLGLEDGFSGMAWLIFHLLWLLIMRPLVGLNKTKCIEVERVVKFLECLQHDFRMFAGLEMKTRAGFISWCYSNYTCRIGKLKTKRLTSLTFTIALLQVVGCTCFIFFTCRCCDLPTSLLLVYQM